MRVIPYGRTGMGGKTAFVIRKAAAKVGTGTTYLTGSRGITINAEGASKAAGALPTSSLSRVENFDRRSTNVRRAQFSSSTKRELASVEVVRSVERCSGEELRHGARRDSMPSTIFDILVDRSHAAIEHWSSINGFKG
jgi:hypothetical protein